MNFKKYDHPRTGTLILNAEMQALVRRRTMPFLDSIGVDRPLSFCLEEVYLQGVRDAAQAIDREDMTR